MIALRFYRIFDIGREIDLDWLEREMAKSYTIARTSFLRVQQKSITIEDPPLTIRMPPLTVGREGKSFAFDVVVRVYDIGAISLCLVHENAGGDFRTLEDIAFCFSGQIGLSGYFEQNLTTLLDIIRPHIRSFAIDPGFFEDYTVYMTDRRDSTIDPVPLLAGERADISPQMREEILRNSLSYTAEDIAIISWDSALLCNPDLSTDLTDLIEYANVQVLELRYYDRELTRQMERMYDDIEEAEQQLRFLRTRQYHAIMARQMETSAEISEIIEKVNNLIKVTEDAYYARVYATALKVFRSGQWSESVSRKIKVIQENYSMLSGEVR
ncbi:MAG: hypothetical protein LUQ40_00045, partial [Methanomicrobiales archaeon]|nr:hypothetical protein [Methanomicrobiales archaeon]